MKFVTVLAAMIFAFVATTTSTHAQGRGNGQAKKTTVSAPKAKTQTPKQTAKAERRTTKATTKAETRAAKATAKADTRAARAETKATKTNTNQDARLVAMLPPGTDLQVAAQGFKNRGQFIAAANASTNHNIPFDELKARMTGIAPGATEPTAAPMSLGQAIQSFNGTTTTTPQP